MCQDAMVKVFMDESISRSQRKEAVLIQSCSNSNIHYYYCYYSKN